MRADRAGHDVLDSVQPRDHMGLAGVVLRAGLLLQLRHRRALRRLAHRRAHTGYLLVHRRAHRQYTMSSRWTLLNYLITFDNI